MDLIIRLSAEKDIQEIYDWYETQLNGLGGKFLDDFQKTLPYLNNYPKSFRFKYKNFRTIPLSEFPYLIYFRIQKQSIIIQKIGHSHRNKRNFKF
ncbi:hypothetical protein BH11BAC7_BH11BAC7_18520 [soil metagenome]